MSRTIRPVSRILVAGVVSAGAAVVARAPVVDAGVLCSTGPDGVPTTQNYSASYMYYMYAATAANEGYNNGDAAFGDLTWPGGQAGVCWNDDDSGLGPGHPVQPGHSYYEGLDCSGLVSKAWGMRANYTTSDAWTYWYYHNAYRPGGFYTGAMYGAADNATWKSLNWGDRNFMDAAVKSGHIVLIVSPSASGTSDQTFEANGHVNGTGYFSSRNLSSGYQAKERKNWGSYPW